MIQRMDRFAQKNMHSGDLHELMNLLLLWTIEKDKAWIVIFVPKAMQLDRTRLNEFGSMTSRKDYILP